MMSEPAGACDRQRLGLGGVNDSVQPITGNIFDHSVLVRRTVAGDIISGEIVVQYQTVSNDLGIEQHGHQQH